MVKVPSIFQPYRVLSRHGYCLTRRHGSTTVTRDPQTANLKIGLQNTNTGTVRLVINEV